MKTDTFFLISNFNTDPVELIEYTNFYHIFDQSNDPYISSALPLKYQNISKSKHSGHNFSDYFSFFFNFYDQLPDWIMLAKGNMIGRHVTIDYFNHTYRNKSYTFMFSEELPVDKPGIQYHLYEGAFLERNNSWYMSQKPHYIFDNMNSYLDFIFINPIKPSWMLFSPGGCYILPKEMILKFSKTFYFNLWKLVTYIHFPAEAYLVERSFHLILNSNYRVRSYMNDSEQFDYELRRRFGSIF